MTHPDTLTIPRAVAEQALEDLKFFCSQRMAPEAWLDSEPLFDDLRAALQPQAAEPNAAFALCLLSAAAKSGDPGAIALAAQLAGVPPCKNCGYVVQHCRCASQAAAEPVADCGEAGHSDGACGNAPCLPKPIAFIRRDQLQKATKQAVLCEVGPDARQDKVGVFATPPATQAALTAALECLRKLDIIEDTPDADMRDATIKLIEATGVKHD